MFGTAERVEAQPIESLGLGLGTLKIYEKLPGVRCQRNGGSPLKFRFYENDCPSCVIPA